MTKKKGVKVGPKRIEKVRQAVIGITCELDQLTQDELRAFIDAELSKIKFKYTPKFKLGKYLNDCVLLEDIDDDDAVDGLEDNAMQVDISVLLELNYDPALIGALAGYKKGVLYILGTDWLYPMQLKELSGQELRYLAIKLAYYTTQKELE